MANTINEQKYENMSKKAFDEEKIHISALDEAIKEYENGKVERYENFDEFKKAMSNEI